MKRNWVDLLLIVVLLSILMIPIAAQTGRMIPFSGAVTVPDGTYDMAFRLFDASERGTYLDYTDFQSDVTVTDGVVSTILGAGTGGAVPALPFASPSVYITIEAPPGTEIGMRVPIYSAGFAHTFAPGALVRGNSSRDPTLTLTNSVGEGLRVVTEGSSGAAFLATQNPNSGPVLFVGSASNSNFGLFVDSGLGGGVSIQTNQNNSREALLVASNGSGPAIHAIKTSGGTAGLFEIPVGVGTALQARSAGGPLGGWAGIFEGRQGVSIRAEPGQPALVVLDGTKNAAVATDQGTRALYTEESSEVWFTDYGFGRLQEGRVLVPIDPLFTQTVNLKEPYHVFLQVYGRAQLYVGERTPTSFEVRLIDGDPDVEFSYRIVAKRLGYESKRLEHFAWADEDPNLYPAKQDGREGK